MIDHTNILPYIYVFQWHPSPSPLRPGRYDRPYYYTIIHLRLSMASPFPLRPGRNDRPCLGRGNRQHGDRGLGHLHAARQPVSNGAKPSTHPTTSRSNTDTFVPIEHWRSNQTPALSTQTPARSTQPLASSNRTRARSPTRHGVTLGATGKPVGNSKRHPTISDGVVLGAGATVLIVVRVASI